MVKSIARELTELLTIVCYINGIIGVLFQVRNNEHQRQFLPLLHDFACNFSKTVAYRLKF